MVKMIMLKEPGSISVHLVLVSDVEDVLCGLELQFWRKIV